MSLTLRDDDNYRRFLPDDLVHFVTEKLAWDVPLRTVWETYLELDRDSEKVKEFALNMQGEQTSKIYGFGHPQSTPEGMEQ